MTELIDIPSIYPFKLSATSDKPANGKSATFGYKAVEIKSPEHLIRVANRSTITPSFFKYEKGERWGNGYGTTAGGHRKNENIIEGGNVLIIDCDGHMEDGTPQYQIIEEKIEKFHYVKVPSASGKDYKWHYIIPTKRTRSMYPQKFKWETEQFFKKVGIALYDTVRAGGSSMCDLPVSLQSSRALAHAGAKDILTAEQADKRSSVHDGEILDLEDAPEDISTEAGSTKAAVRNTKSKSYKKYEHTEQLPAGTVWFFGNPMSYDEAYSTIKEQIGSKGGTLSGFGCPHDNHRHTGDKTKGYGVAYLFDGVTPTIKCTGNACVAQPYFVLPEPSVEVEEETVKIDMVELPVHPITFEKQLSEKLLELQPKFCISENMEDVFRGYASIFNRANNDNKDGLISRRHISPLATGSAKTTAMKLYSAMTTEACILIVRKAMTAVEIVRDINDWAKDTPARCFYSIDPRNGRPNTIERAEKDDLCNHRVIVLTHNMFHRLSQAEEPGNDIFNDIMGVDTLKPYVSYKGSRRNTIVIDERIDLIQQQDFRNNEITETLEIIRDNTDLEIHEDIGQAAAILQELNDTVFTYNADKKDGSTDKFGLYDKEELSHIKNNIWIFDFLIAAIRKDHINLRKKSVVRKINKSDEEQTKKQKAYIDLLERVKFVCSNNLMLFKSGKLTTVTAVKDLSLAFGSTTILDATANVNQTYLSYQHHQPEKTMMYERIQIRNYKNTTFNIHTGVPQSKYALYSKKDSPTAKGTRPLTEEELKDKANAYLSVLYSVVKTEDNMLVVVHKSVLHTFSALNKHKNITFINWGMHAGSNAWSHFNKACIIGWYRISKHIQANQLFAGAAGYHNYEPTTSYDTDVQNLEDSAIVEDMIQFFNRIRCRVPTDIEGNHEPVDLYLFKSKSDKDSEIIANMIEEFPNAKVKKWKIEAKDLTDTKVKKKTKMVERADLIIDKLKMMRNEYDDILAEKIRNSLGTTKRAFSNTIQSDYFKEKLEANDIVYETVKDSHGGLMKFAFK